MAWSTPEDAAVFAARKRHELCRLLGGGDVTKGLHRLLLAERRVERRLDSEHRNDSPAPRLVPGHAAAAPTRAPAATGAGMTKDAAPPRRNTAAEKRKLRSAARLQEFQAVKRQQLADTATAAHSPSTSPRHGDGAGRERRRVRWVWPLVWREARRRPARPGIGLAPCLSRLALWLAPAFGPAPHIRGCPPEQPAR